LRWNNGTNLEVSARVDWRIRWTIAVISRHLDRPLRLAELAAKMNLSPSRFSHLFRSECGCAPGAYVRSLRLERARALLAETNLSVKQVMSVVGMSDPSHFVRDFKRKFGESPTVWRSRARANAFTPFVDRRRAVE
jgi:transcriptional regulator GlxA family with amidase domain